MPDLVGHTLLGRYRVTDFLGRGGMAEVYKAWDAKRATYVALKVLNDDLAADAVFLRRFAREGRALAKLMHPNIVRYLGFEQAPGLAFMVMEYIEGITLRRFMGLLGRPLNLPEAIGVLQPTCSALHYAHEMGVFHCDIKPANVFIERGGRIVLGDFGIARMSESATVTLSSIGTPAYMSPEQCPGGRPIDGRTDIYSLSITAYEMLTTDRPFKGETGSTSVSLAERILWEQLNLPPPPPRRLNPQIPPAVENGIMRALAKDPAWRQQQVLAFCEEIRRGARVQPVRVSPEMVEGRAAAAALPSVPVSRPQAQSAGAATVRPKARRSSTGLLAAVAGIVIVAVALLVVAVVLRPWETLTATPGPPNTSGPATDVAATITAEPGDGGAAPTSPEEPTQPPQTEVPPPTPTPEPSNVHVLYVLDAAEGMQTSLGSQTKLTAGRIAIVDNLAHVQSTGAPINAGLLVFGHRIRDPRDDGNCGDANVEVHLPVLAGSAVAIRDFLETLGSEHGGAPLGNAIRQAYGEFRFTPDRTNAIILIAGANSFCGEDPLGQIARNAEVGQKLPIFVAALSVSGEAERELLATIAEATGGLYRDAASTSDLVRVLAEFVDVIRE